MKGWKNERMKEWKNERRRRRRKGEGEGEYLLLSWTFLHACRIAAVPPAGSLHPAKERIRKIQRKK